MGSYSVILSENAYRDLKKIDRLKLPQPQVLRIFEAVKSLEDDLRPRGCKKLEGASIPLYRIKLGRKGYRIITRSTTRRKRLMSYISVIAERRIESCVKPLRSVLRLSAPTRLSRSVPNVPF